MDDRVIDAVLELMQGMTDMPVRRAVLPAGEGVSIEKGTSDIVVTSLDRSTIEEISCVVNAKSTDLVKARQAVSFMHQRLPRLSEYPNNEQYQITAIETISGPTTIGREAGGYWTVGSIIRIKYYNKESAENG